ncbi:MAG TPA: peptidylprolyl isomerase [Desulfatiglandales bacterium]|nr:peptidylprolyl isomerase [Desulfatiglandales bacterium]
MRKLVLIFFFILMFNIQCAWANQSKPRVRLETSHGVIVLELDPQAAPKTVENFLSYVDNKFYDFTIFHRVIKGFMIQGGGLTVDMQKKTTAEAIINEADNGLKNLRGTVAMARTMDPNSATAQFFINTVNNSFLDYKEKTMQGWGYCVFGKVVEGMNVVDAIENTPTHTQTGHQNVPVSAVIIQRASVDK